MTPAPAPPVVALGATSPVTPTVASAPAPAVAACAHSSSSRKGDAHTGAKAEPGQEATEVRQDWTAHIHFKKYELDQSRTVLHFLGNVPADASKWRISPSFVGATVAFVNSVTGRCANCREQADFEVEDFVHLHKAIAKLSGRPSFEPDVAIPYLRENLHW